MVSDRKIGQLNTTYELAASGAYIFNNQASEFIFVGSGGTHNIDASPTPEDNIYDVYLPEVMSYSDYYPFGAPLPGRSSGSSDYKYGFNGMEMDNEVSGTGNSYTAEFWQYDPRLGRRWNMDPEIEDMPDVSPYATFLNNPIVFTDPDGDCPWCVVFDYVTQVGGNLISGDGFYDAFVGNIEVESLLLSALPGSKYLKAAYEVIDAKVDFTINDGAKMNDNLDAFKEILTGKISKKATKKVNKFLKKVTSDKVMKQITKRLTNANNKVAKYENKMKKGNLTDKQMKNYQKALQDQKLNSFAKNAAQGFRDTYGKMSQNQKDLASHAFERNLNDAIKPVVSDGIDSIINTGRDTTDTGKRQRVKVKF